jgi:hypothetical protein
MKKKNEPTMLESLKEQADRIRDSWGTPISERYHVIEIEPPRRYSYDNGHGGTEYDWTPYKRTRVSPYFNTEQECMNWMEEYEPDKGNTFEVKKEVLYERIVREWH